MNAGLHHGRPMHSRLGKHQVDLYFWDERNGADWQGWWLGIRGNPNMAYGKSDSVEHVPPRYGWRVPYSGPIDNTITIIGPPERQD